ncbi:MAG: DUF2461 domain-containing protein [Bacteroidales bacterium]|nr:DUF2461 domain-containing protein [Bacteroidales bacterium]
MNDGYYVPRLFEFLKELAAHNNREWFAEHKALYTELRARWEEDVTRLIGYMAAWEPRMAHMTARDCVYRIYRDIRFSPDKTPFKTYMSAGLGPYGKKSSRAGYYLHFDPSAEGGLYGGLWCPDSAMLRKMRKAIVDNIEEFESIVENPALQQAFPQWCGSALKTVPKGYDRNHPQAQYLRMKDYGRFSRVTAREFSDPSWPEMAAERFSKLAPFIEFINYSLDE